MYYYGRLFTGMDTYDHSLFEETKTSEYPSSKNTPPQVIIMGPMTISMECLLLESSKSKVGPVTPQTQEQEQRLEEEDGDEADEQQQDPNRNKDEPKKVLQHNVMQSNGETKAIQLEQSLKSLLKELDECPTFIVGSPIWIQSIQQQILHLSNLTDVFRSIAMTNNNNNNNNNNNSNNNSHNNVPTGRIRFVLHIWKSQIITVIRAVFYVTSSSSSFVSSSASSTHHPSDVATTTTTTTTTTTFHSSSSTRSRIRHLHRTAAICLRVLVQTLCNTTTMETNNNDNSNTRNGSTSAMIPQIPSCILALLRGLPSEQSHSLPPTWTTTNNTTTTRTQQQQQRSLEDPIPTWIELLMTIQELLHVYPPDEIDTDVDTNDSSNNNDDNNSENSKEKKSIHHIKKQTILVRLVGLMTSMMTMTNIDLYGEDGLTNRNHDNASNGTTILSSTTTMSTNNKINTNIVMLRIQSVKVLHLCMETKISTKKNDNDEKDYDADADSVILWRSMFPGILVTIFRCLVSCHRSTSTSSLVTLECSCLDILHKLILLTLHPIQQKRIQKTTTTTPTFDEDLSSKTGKTTATTTSMSTTMAMLQKLQMKGIQRDLTPSDNIPNEDRERRDNHKNDDDNDDDDFLFNVHDKAVSHLILMLKQSMASRSSKVKIHAIQLVRTILIDTNLCWKGCSTLEESALECCLMMISSSKNDKNVDGSMAEDDDAHTYPQEDVVSDAAWSVVESYHSTSDNQSTVFLKLLTLIQELPSILEGGKSIDCTMRLQLIQGYLQILGNHGPSSTPVEKAKTISLTASSFPSLPFIQIMAVDFTASSRSSQLFEEVYKDDETDTIPQSRLPIRRLSLEQTKSIRRILVSSSQTLGPKQGAFVVDTLLSDILEIWHCEYLSLSTLEQWAGRLAVASQILFGAFSSQQACQEGNRTNASKDDRRRRKILNALASSVLPLLMDPPLHMWNPSNLLIQQGIASVLILSLEFSSVIVKLMTTNNTHGAEGDSESLFQSILYVLISRAHGHNGTMIQQTAREVMDNISKATNHRSRSDFIADRAGMLFGEMLSRLRIPGGGGRRERESSTVSSVKETFSVVFVLTWVLEECPSNQDSSPYTDAMSQACTTLIELVTVLVGRLDYHFLNRSVHEEEAIQLTRLYGAIFKYLRLRHFVEDATAATFGKNKERQAQSWLGLLSAFENNPIEVDTMNEDSMGYNEEEFETKSHHRKSEASHFGKASVTLSTEIISRLCLLLSYQSLPVRIAACESLTSGFEYLGQGTRELDADEGEEADIRNAVYRQVATSWPSIKARLSMVTDQVVERLRPISSLLIVTADAPHNHSNVSSLDDSKQVVTSRTANDNGSQRYFLSRLYVLIASMFECSGDFMADRFGSSVWPIMAQEFEYLMMKTRKTVHPSPKRTCRLGNVDNVAMIPAVVTPRGEHETWSITHSWVDSELHLALGMVQCLKRVFSSDGSHGTTLGRIYQAVGLVLLPLLECRDDEDPEFSHAVMDAIKTILSHNVDILLRPLLELSGKGIPPCPIHLSTGSVQIQNNHDLKSGKPQCSPKVTIRLSMAQRCHELLEHIAAQPEQDLD